MFDLPIEVTKTYTKSENIRKHWHTQFPSEREVSVQTEQGHMARLRVSFSAYSGELRPGRDTNPVFTQNVRGGCAYVRTTASASWARFGWSVRNPSAPAACHSQGDNGDAGFTQLFQSNWLGLGLRITSPSPLGLQNGIYTGTLTYSLGGAGKDIDFGDDVIVSDDSLTFRFEFTVAHELKVTRADHADRIVLQPDRGWPSWFDHGGSASPLRGEMTLLLSSSAPFSLSLQCQYMVDTQCALRSDRDGTDVPLSTSVTFPGIQAMDTKAPAIRYPLTHHRRYPFENVEGYVANRPSRVHFEVSSNATPIMAKQPGSLWRGDVTLVFDSQL
ncbi:MAG TPA: hypothetical protein VIM98_18190 [Dyella sp.]|uniref:hypothetical protein n=1 Tax=Dyella sp. TaxID=1869338 RepID=UPI002F91DF82